ncbi:MAG: PASTA domain-containing protein [Sediminibacterium sp.]|nr:PASTA domain-containing protein [Sediminibacterium sp.]
MADNSFDFMKDVLAAPLGDIISSVGTGVAEAQAALDAASLSQTLAIYNTSNSDETTSLLRNIGYQPTFYALPETEVEAQITLALSMSESYSGNPSGLQNNGRIKTRIYATPANATVTNTFNLNVNAFSKIKFKIVPVPPPNDTAEMRVVPDIKNKTIEEAEELLNQLGLKISVTGTPPGSAVITQQVPAAGSILKAGESITITV